LMVSEGKAVVGGRGWREKRKEEKRGDGKG
jgi:hypothetical protein